MIYLKRLKDSIIKLSLSIFSALFLASTTLIIIIYMQGYTIDFKQRTIIETGALIIKTLPRKANIFINNELSGTSKKVFTALETGDNYQLRVEKDKYRSYKQKTTIFHGLATILDTQLIYSEGIKQQKFSIISPDPQIITSTEGNQTFVATLHNNKNSKGLFNNTLTLESYYYSNRVLSTPQITKKTISKISVLHKQKLTWKDLTILTNFDGSNLLIGILDKAILINPYIFDQTIDWKDVDSLLLTQHLLNKDLISWKDSINYILIESKNQLLTYNVNTQVKTVLYEKPNNTTIKYVYLADQIAILENIKTKNGFKHNLISYPMSGGVALFTLSLTNEILDSEIINDFWGDLETSIFALSTNKGSFILGDLFRKSSGLVIDNNSKEIYPKANIQKMTVPEMNREMSLILLTDTNILEVQFMPTKHFVSFVTISDKKTTINRFIYNKEEPDMFNHLGKRVIYETSNKLNIIRWVNNGNYLAFTEKKSLKYISPRGQNMYQLFTEKKSFQVIILPKDQFILLFKQNSSLVQLNELPDKESPITTTSKTIWTGEFIELFE